MRFKPGAPDQFSGALGVRTGPRLSAPLSRQLRLAGSTYTFHGDRDSFAFPQWGVAYDFTLARPLTERTAVHLGLQGELYDPIPVPGYGVYVGASQFYAFGSVSVAPALCIRGATDFGVLAPGGPGSIAGVEASMTFTYSPDRFVSVGFVPFFGLHHVWSDRADSQATYLGAVVAAVITLPLTTVELSSGFGRVFMPGLDSWNVPIIGVRAER